MKQAKKIILYFVALVPIPIILTVLAVVGNEAHNLYLSDTDAIRSLKLGIPKTIFGPNSSAKKAYRGEVAPPDDKGFFFDEIQVGVFLNAPSVHYIYKTPAQTTNVFVDPLGFRVGGPRDTVEKIDILAIGDSLTWGHGLKFNETFPAIIAERLGIKLGNAAIPGNNGVQALLGMDWHLVLKPKYILFGFYEDMIYRNIARAGHRPLLGKLEDRAGFHIRPGGTIIDQRNYIPVPMRWATELASDLGMDELLINAFFFRLKHHLYRFRQLFFKDSLLQRAAYVFNSGMRPKKLDPLMTPIAIDGMTYVLTEIKKKADKIGARLIVAYFPIVFDGVNYMRTPKVWIKTAREQGFLFVDMEPLIYKYVKEATLSEIIIPNDKHFNANANRIIAEQVIEAIERLEKGRQPAR